MAGRLAVALRALPLLSLAGASYSTLSAVAHHEEVIKKSRFVAIASPVKSAEDALAFVKSNSDAKARHNCFAWRLNDGTMRTNGDGEPGGTAGPPILAAIDGAGLLDVAVVVQRFRLDGGAKLGTGGLVRAYGGAAEACLANGEVRSVEATSLMSVRFNAEDTGVVFAALGQYSPSICDEGTAEDGVGLETSFEAPADAAPRIAAALRDATAGRIEGIWVASTDDDFPFPEFVQAEGGGSKGSES